MTLLHGTGLSLSLSGQLILDQVDIELMPGEMLGLIGPNGAGKSSLLKLIAGLLKADSGNLTLDDRPVSSLSPKQRARRIAWLSQQGEVHWPVTVESLIELGRIPHWVPWQPPGTKDRQLIEQVLHECDLSHLRQRPINTLSGGERARVLLARALVTQPQILLADEPVAALDLAHQLDVMELLQNYCGHSNGVIVVLHDLSLAARFCQRLLLLHQGRVMAGGRADQVLSRDNLAVAYQVELDQTAPSASPFPLIWRRIEHRQQ